jgi:hypothetical protein
MAKSQGIRAGPGSRVLINESCAVLNHRISPLPGPVHNVFLQSPDHDQIISFFNETTADRAASGFDLGVAGNVALVPFQIID